jgi:hypothetical protein
MRIQRYAALALAMVGILSCSDLTSVDAPDVIKAGSANPVVLAAGAVSEFSRAFGGDDPQIHAPIVMASGLISDELMDTGLGGFYGDMDSRSTQDPSQSSVGLGSLYAARGNALNAIVAFRASMPDSATRIAHLLALVAFTEDFLGENYCSGMPLGRLDSNLQPVPGTQLTTTEMFQQAISDFDSALAIAPAGSAIANLAAVGKGRALLNQAKFPQAAQAVATVPTSFTFNATYISSSIFNAAFSFVNRLSTLKGFTIPQSEGGNGINWHTANDPRAIVTNGSPPMTGYDGVTQIWIAGKYPTQNSPINLASGIEARLIEAEAKLQASDVPGWLSVHNVLRATVTGLAPLTDPGTTAARVDLHFRERAFWLFLTNHRQGDLRRLIRQYQRPTETVFPTGPWRNGVPYGPAVTLVPGADMPNNPNWKGCIDKNA